MSQSPGSSTQCGSLNSVPGWIASGMLGLAIGAGATVVFMRNAHVEDLAAQEKAWAAAASNSTGTPPPAGTSSPGGPGPGGGGPPAMGMGGMGGGRGGMGGGGGGGGKRALTALVGKLELLSRPDMKLHVELNADQAKAIADKLEAFDKAEKMTGDEAQESADALEALLTPEQKEVVNAIGLPGGGRGGPGGGGGGGGGGGRGAAGRPGGGGPPSGGPPGGGPPGGGPGGPMMMMGGGGNPDENPFTQEANQKRLRDLRDRLSATSGEGEAKSQ
jgi:translation initiation factor IF-2